MPIPKAFASYCHFTNLSRSGVPWCAVLKHESRECFWTRIEYELNGNKNKPFYGQRYMVNVSSTRTKLYTTSLLRRTRVIVTEEELLVTEDSCIVTEDKVYFCFCPFSRNGARGFPVFVFSAETAQGGGRWKAALRHSPHVPRSRLR